MRRRSSIRVLSTACSFPKMLMRAGSSACEGKRTTVAALHDARKRGERGARGVETNEERPEPLDLAHRTRLTSFHSVRACRLGGHVRDARRSIHETHPSSLRARRTGLLIKRPIDGTRVRGCARRHDARAVPWMSVPRSRREGTRASPIPTLSRTIRVSLRAQPRERRVGFLGAARLPIRICRQTTDGSFPRPGPKRPETRRRFPEGGRRTDPRAPSLSIEQTAARHRREPRAEPARRRRAHARARGAVRRRQRRSEPEPSGGAGVAAWSCTAGRRVGARRSRGGDRAVAGAGRNATDAEWRTRGTVSTVSTSSGASRLCGTRRTERETDGNRRRSARGAGIKYSFAAADDAPLVAQPGGDALVGRFVATAPGAGLTAAAADAIVACLAHQSAALERSSSGCVFRRRRLWAFRGNPAAGLVRLLAVLELRLRARFAPERTPAGFTSFRTSRSRTSLATSMTHRQSSPGVRDVALDAALAAAPRMSVEGMTRRFRPPATLQRDSTKRARKRIRAGRGRAVYHLGKSRRRGVERVGRELGGRGRHDARRSVRMRRVKRRSRKTLAKDARERRFGN